MNARTRRKRTNALKRNAPGHLPASWTSLSDVELTERYVAFLEKRAAMVRVTQQGHRRLTLNVNEPEAKGTIVLEESAYGATLHVNGQCLALVDLFPFSPAGRSILPDHQPTARPQLAVYDGTSDSDALGNVFWRADGRVEIVVNQPGIEYACEGDTHTLSIPAK